MIFPLTTKLRLVGTPCSSGTAKIFTGAFHEELMKIRFMLKTMVKDSETVCE